MNLRRLFTLGCLMIMALPLVQAQETTGVNVGVGTVLLLRKVERHGAIVPREIHVPTGRFAFDWYLLPGEEKNFGSQEVQSGYNIVYLEDGKAAVSFASFALQLVQGPGGQVLLRSASKPGLHTNNIYFSFAHVSKIDQVNLNTSDYQFALMPGPPRDVAFDEDLARAAFAPTPPIDEQFYPANASIISASGLVLKWPAKNEAVAYRVDVAVIQPSLLGKRPYPIAWARRTSGTSIALSDMEPVEYDDNSSVAPFRDVEGVLAENAPPEILEPYLGRRKTMGNLVPGRLYAWRVIPLRQSDVDTAFDFKFTTATDSFYKIWIEFKVEEETGK